MNLFQDEIFWFSVEYCRTVVNVYSFMAWELCHGTIVTNTAAAPSRNYRISCINYYGMCAWKIKACKSCSASFLCLPIGRFRIVEHKRVCARVCACVRACVRASSNFHQYNKIHMSDALVSNAEKSPYSVQIRATGHAKRRGYRISNT